MKKNTWNVDESFVPLAQRTSVLYFRLSDFWISPLRLRYLKKSKAKALHVRDCIIFQGKNLLRKENKKDGTGTWSNDPIWSSLALAKLSLLTKAPTLEGCWGGFAQNKNYHKVPDNSGLPETNFLLLLLLLLGFIIKLMEL